jgi:hypothetical protein
MKAESDPAAGLLTTLPAPGPPEALRQRTLALAKAQLKPGPQSTPRPWRHALPTYATSAALLSADAAFLVNACLDIKRAFGG